MGAKRGAQGYFDRCSCLRFKIVFMAVAPVSITGRS